MSIVYSDEASNMHPYECDGPGDCWHCDRRMSGMHDPRTCSLCDPAYDHRPNPYWTGKEKPA